MNTQNKNRIAIVIGVVLLLLIPLVAMQFTNEVNWGPLDFLIAGFLLLAAGLTCELVISKVTKAENRILICSGIIVVAILIWVELAVDIFGTVFAGA